MATTKKPAVAASPKANVETKAPVSVRTVPRVSSAPQAPVKSAAELKAAAALENAAAQGRAALQLQMKEWEQAVALFSQKKFAPAQAGFEKASLGPAAHIADKARSYAQICARKTNQPAVRLETADDHFNHGVERLNVRDMDAARQHLNQALLLDPNGEHILFTLALCCGLAGDAAAACENLKRAIDLEPKNRILARQDPEFLTLAQQIPGIRALLAPPETVDSF
jgi:tetratricopeptide (TPR) repeat protein